MDTLNTSLTSSQAAFAVWIEDKMPYLLPLFDFSLPGYDPEAVEKFMGVASHAQAIMARFALGVWRHNDQFEFDFIEAAQTLDEKNMRIIADWLQNPFWP